ncbi:unnamed protein product [Lymnaea stagnalis]|uniref:Spatacsin C-terminal domain-containing protein n=1 Tax=Lymnaea stagnalis TaxID=6523 RepID=A0AAV2GZ20_LYMST
MATPPNDCMDCRLLTLHFWNQQPPKFVWLKISTHQDTLAAQHEDGTFSILKIKDRGQVLNFVLDPNLQCVFWDHDDSSELSQRLYAQSCSKDILLYAVSDDGVTEILHIPYSKLNSAIKEYLSNEKEIQLVGCDRGHIILSNSLNLICVQVTSEGFINFRYNVHLPQERTTPENSQSRIAVLPKYQILNGSIVIYDPSSLMIYIHSLILKMCICEVNLQTLSAELDSLSSWKMSYDLSVLMLLSKDWTVVSVNITEYAHLFPDHVRNMEYSSHGQAGTRTYMSYNLCRYGDLTWKQEVVDQHLNISACSGHGKKPCGLGCSTNVIGFHVLNKKKEKTVSAPINSDAISSYKLSLQLDNKINTKIWQVAALEVSHDLLALVLFRQDCTLRAGKHLALCFANFADKSVYFHDIGETTSVALSDKPSCSHILMSDKYLMFVSPHGHLHKDGLISWMMSYSGPSAADNLCQANQWTRTAVPLHTLEASLQQRQLDTLAFFFKSKQDLFSSTLQHSHSNVLVSEVRQLDDALRLVATTVSSNLLESQARIFAERLLSLTLEFVYSLLGDARQVTLSNSGFFGKEDEMKAACEMLMSYVPALRKSMKVLQSRSTQSRAQSQSSELTRTFGLDEPTEQPPSIESFIKENKLSCLQAVLMSRPDGTKLHYRDLVIQTISIVKTHLEKKDILSCQHILNNLGCNVSSTLWSLAQFYMSRSLQKFISSQLSTAASLSHPQRQLVQFLDQLYQAYPVQSFNAVMKRKVHDHQRTWPDFEDPLKKVLPAQDVFLLNHCGELSQDNPPDCGPGQSDLYVAVCMAWASTWSDDMKRAVLTEAQFLASEDITSAIKTDPTSAWKYLMSHNLIEVVLPILESVRKEVTFPWPTDPTQYLHYGWSHLRQEVARELLRQKKLNVDSMSKHDIDVSALIPSVGGLMQKPHPLSYVDSAYLKQHHVECITQFVTAGLQLPVWMYCTVHGINPSEMTINHNCSWFPLFQAVHAIPRHPSDKTLVLSASLLAAADLWSFSTGQMSVEKMLEKNQIYAAVGTLSYMTDGITNLNASTVEKCLRKFPKLMAALMPDGMEATSKQNTSVYQLLMGTAPFDLRRLFGWQTTNTFAGEDSFKVMPHFSEPELTTIHSRHQRLAFPYYLKHGRPVYAFLSFLSEELDRSEAALSQKRIHQACGAALWMACQNFNTPSISSACVIFVELLGQDSAHVRTMLNAGRLLLAHKHRNVSGSAEARQEQLKACAVDIVSDLLACVRSCRHHGNKLIKSLEASIEDEIKHEVIDRCSFEASHKWMLVNLLCEQLSLPLSTCFLKACAESDNWFMFVWYSQLHQYPTHQLQNLLHAFRSPNLRDHLHYVLNNADSKWFSTASTGAVSSHHIPKEKKSLQSQRAYLYSKVGVQRSRDRSSTSSDEEEVKRGSSSISAFSSRLKQSELNECEMQESTAPDDVFRMLFHSQSMPSQWRCLLSAAISLKNPLFAELAVCCGCPPIASLCGWLLASIPSEAKQSFLTKYGQYVSKWTTDQLEALIETTLCCGQEDSLATAFTLLQPYSPLLHFLNFVAEFVKGGNYSTSKVYLDQFKEAMASLDMKSAKERPSTEIATIGDRAWYERVTYQVLKHELKAVGSLYQAKHLLEFLDKQNMCLVFSFDVLDFGLLHKVVTVLDANSVPGVQLGALLTSGTTSDTFVMECESAVDYLISCGNYSEAHQLAKMAGISREGVTISQLKAEKESLLACGLWSAKFVRTQYWMKSTMLMLHAECKPEACGNFFQSFMYDSYEDNLCFQTELQGTSVELEKAILCQHWLFLLENKNEADVAAIRDIVFRNMWRHRIAAKVSIEEQEPLDEIFDLVDETATQRGDLKTDLLQKISLQHSGSDELEVLDTLMGSYLDDGRVSACAQVAAVFGHYHQDLAIVQTCIALANGHSHIENMEPAMRRLVAKSSTARTRRVSVNLNRSYSIGSINSLTSYQADSSTLNEGNEVINVMEKLYAHCVKGTQVCLRIITCYKIAELLAMKFKDIVTNSEFDSLRLLLKVGNPNKFSLARDFLSTSGLTDDEITGFLADLIVDVLKSLVKGDLDSDLGAVSSNQKDNAFNPAQGMNIFSQFLMLTDNAALLGSRILQSVASLLTSGQQEMSSTVLTIQTELIIMSHECYTISSNMEGISHVLRAARVCCDCLAAGAQYGLMIRLLTGVGRYSEMLYIFHALQQNHQFELLLRKGMDREDKLKVAILDYLKRYQPDDNESYTMVALKFTMYRDIAGMLEACGHKSMKLFKDKPLENSKETQELLKKCLQYFQDAAESYVKDNSVRKAQHCVKLARLLSLQLQLLANGVQVIELTRDQLTNFVNTHNRFIEAMVVSDAYERRTDWSEATFNNVVVNGDMRYLQEMKLHVRITPSLVEDVVKRYKQLTVKPNAAIQPLRKLLSLCKDAQLQYRLANELGLTDIVTALLKGDTSNYLQDISVI